MKEKKGVLLFEDASKRRLCYSYNAKPATIKITGATRGKRSLARSIQSRLSRRLFPSAAARLSFRLCSRRTAPDFLSSTSTSGSFRSFATVERGEDLVVLARLRRRVFSCTAIALPLVVISIGGVVRSKPRR